MEDPLQDLEDAGVLGIVDPARIIPKYKLSSMMNKTQSKKGKEKVGKAIEEAKKLLDEL